MPQRILFVLADGWLQFVCKRTQAVGNVGDAAKIRDMARLTGVFEKLQDLARGVERLRTAIGRVGERRYSELCREINLASGSIDDVPDRATLRRLLGML